MLKTIGIGFGVVAGVVALLAWAPAHSSSAQVLPVAQVASAMLPPEATAEVPVEPAPPAIDPMDQVRHDSLQQYVLGKMKKWAPANTMPKKDISHYDSIADDIATVVLDKDELPLWTWDTSKGKTATLVTTIAFFEGRFWRHVDDGSCNDSKWRKSKEGITTMGVTGNCDGGYAWSIFQVHVEFGGILLTENGEWTHAVYGKQGVTEKPILGADMIADRKVAIRTALHFLRKSLHIAAGSLCGYTGETEAGCPKAKIRQGFANAEYTKDPYKAPTAPVAAQ